MNLLDLDARWRRFHDEDRECPCCGRRFNGIFDVGFGHPDAWPHGPLPEGEAERIAQLQQMQAVQSGMDHFGAERMPQIQTFNTVDALDGQVVRMGGYVLPFDFTGSREISRFLLVPYVGACIHVPPPPPNQLVYVHAEEPIQIQGLWDPVYVKGVMRTDRHDNELGDTAYTLELTEIQPYES